MKLCTFSAADGEHIGVLTERGVTDVTAAGLSGDMRTIIENRRIALDVIISMAEAGTLPVIEPQSLKYLPVTRPNKVVCAGLNYYGHARELELAIPAEPVIFCKFQDAVTGHGSMIRLPEGYFKFDFEAELVVVIGRTLWMADDAEAERGIFGYTCGNDLSERESQFVSSQWLIGKAFPGSAPVGAFITTADEFEPMAEHDIQCRVNGELVQSGVTSDMIFTPAHIVSYISHHIRLEPGDLVFTGTPAGVMTGRPEAEQRWLRAGDMVEVTIDGLGSLAVRLK